VSSIDDPTSSGQAWPPPRDLIIGWSGSRLDPLKNEQHAAIVQARLTLLPRTPKGFVTGACIGIDHRVGFWLSQVFPHVPHLILVPADRSRVSRWWEGHDFQGDPDSKITVREMPPGATYADRNQEIVRWSNVLCAFPQYSEDHPKSVRSGTWQTIRMARQAHTLAPFTYPLEGQ
jgi:hypothetical protein